MATSIDKLQQQLSGHLFAGDSQQVWLLFDAMGMDVRDGLSDSVPDEDIHIVPLGRKDIPAERYPHLVSIHSHDVERLRASLELAMAEQGDPDAEQQDGFAIGGWLQSSEEPQKLARHLATVMNQRVPGEGRMYFRWADRRVMEWMWPTLDASNRAALLGPMTHWWTLDRKSAFVDRHASAPTDATLLWRVSETGWKHALDCEPAQALIRGWQRFATLPSDYLGKAAQAVRGARSLGLTEQSDIVLMGAYILQVHPSLYSHPRMREQVHQAIEHNTSLAEALDGIPDPKGWDQMRDELSGVAAPTTYTTRSMRHG